MDRFLLVARHAWYRMMKLRAVPKESCPGRLHTHFRCTLDCLLALLPMSAVTADCSPLLSWPSTDADGAGGSSGNSRRLHVTFQQWQPQTADFPSCQLFQEQELMQQLCATNCKSQPTPGLLYREQVCSHIPQFTLRVCEKHTSLQGGTTLGDSYWCTVTTVLQGEYSIRYVLMCWLQSEKSWTLTRVHMRVVTWGT